MDVSTCWEIGRMDYMVNKVAAKSSTIRSDISNNIHVLKCFTSCVCSQGNGMKMESVVLWSMV